MSSTPTQPGAPVVALIGTGTNGKPRLRWYKGVYMIDSEGDPSVKPYSKPAFLCVADPACRVTKPLEGDKPLGSWCELQSNP